MHVYNSVSALSDADYVARLCDRVEKDLDQGMLPVEVFNDERVFRAEMDRIFTRTWVFLGHETEIPQSGDFMLRKIGLDQVIVTRTGKGEIVRRVYSNEITEEELRTMARSRNVARVRGGGVFMAGNGVGSGAC